MPRSLCLLAVLAAFSSAPARADNPSGYLISAQDGVPVTTASGCVRTADWTSGAGYRECEAHSETLEPRADSTPLRISIDTLFDFDSAVLRPDAGPALDELAKNIAGTQYKSIRIVGHADRIGRSKYNQMLSELRAVAVRDYLAGQGLDAGKISTAGMGNAVPVTGAQCEGLRGKSLVSCLQPDRAAEVTVIGTQTSAMR